MIAGRSGLGKSFLGRDILEPWKDVDKIAVFSGSEIANCQWGGTCRACNGDVACQYPENHTCRIPFAAVNTKYDKEEIKRLFLLQHREVMEKGYAKARGLFIIIDDCSDESADMNKDQYLKKILQLGRHVKIGIIFIMHHLLLLNPALRRQMDVVCVLAQTEEAVMKTLRTEYLSAIGTLSEVTRVVDVLTEDKGALIYVNGTTTSALKDRVFKYRARHKNYVMGHPKWREMCFKKGLTRKEVIAREIKTMELSSGNPRKRNSRVPKLHIRVMSKSGRIVSEAIK